MRKIKITVDTGYVGATHYDECELPDDWDEMDEEEQREFLDSCAQESICNYIEANAEVVDE